MARLPREAVSLWKPIARSVFHDSGYQDQVRQSMKVLRMYLRNQAEYADEKHHEKPRPARWDHRVNVEYDHAGMSCQVGRSQTKQAKARNAPYRGNQYTLRCEERENMKCMRSLSDRTEECVCEIRKINDEDQAGDYWTHSYRFLPGHRSDPPYETQ